MSELVLYIVHHDGSEETRELPDGVLGVGRAAENWLCPLDTTLSRRHSLLRVDGDALWVESLPSRNGTLVNGRRIESTERLRPGDEIAVGRTSIRVASRRGASDERREQATVELCGGELDSGPEIVAASQAMRGLLDTADRFAGSDLPVLICGESGTGKELLAHRLHRRSSRSSRTFVVLNCPALPEGVLASELFGVEKGVATGVSPRSGRLEQADGGTLFLDEVADLSPDGQAMLLRFLAEGTLERVGGRGVIAVDVRIVAATNRDLASAIGDGRFRSDLYYRIAALRLDIPPLRERVADVVPLAEHVIARRRGRTLRLTGAARAVLETYAFPGNVRELEAVIERAALLASGDEIGVRELGLGGAGDDAAPAAREADLAAHLLDRIVDGDGDFWQLVYRPYSERELPRAVVRELVALAMDRSQGTVRSLAALLRVEDQYRKLLDFLRNNRLS